MSTQKELQVNIVNLTMRLVPNLREINPAFDLLPQLEPELPRHEVAPVSLGYWSAALDVQTRLH